VTRPGDPRPHPAEEPTGLYAEAARIRHLLGGPPTTTSPTPAGPPPGDWLAEIRTRWLGDEQHRAEWWADYASRDVPRLLAEVTRLRDEAERLRRSEAQARSVIALHQQNGCGAQLHAEALRLQVTRLKGRLGELEWAGNWYEEREPACPVCRAVQLGDGVQLPGRHAPGCWMPELLGR